VLTFQKGWNVPHGKFNATGRNGELAAAAFKFSLAVCNHKAMATDEFNEICTLVTNLCEKVRSDLGNHQTNESVSQKVMLYWFAKAAKTYDAVLLLWREGYWQDAAALSRTILEISFQATYLSGDPEPRAALFKSHDEQQRLKMLKTVDKYNDPSDTEIADLIKSLTPSPAALEPWHNWWDKNKKIYDLASPGMEQQYVANYHLLSAFIHSTPVGISFYLFGTGDTVNVDWKANRPAPQRESTAETIIATAGAYMMDIIHVLGEIYGFDYSAELQHAADALKRFSQK
jgi:Family of unknown function (DUF5677)